jgi:hypothetical protein
MRKHCWVYYDKKEDELVLVRKPYKRALTPRYSAWQEIGRNTQYVLTSYYEMSLKSLVKNYEYLGRL